jgi:chloride channel protein, CIC family
VKSLRGTTSLVVATVTTGLLSGLGAVGFHYIADTLGTVLFEWAYEQTPGSRLAGVILVPTIGLGLIGLILQKFPVGRKGGVQEVIESLEDHAGVISVTRMLNVVLSGFVLAFGGSVGPEGPMVQMGALFGSLIGQRTGTDHNTLQTMVRAGAAAGIAAAFRSPAGGVLLTLEVFGARFNRDLTAISAAAAIGYLTRVALLGDAYPFRPPTPAQPLPLLALLTIVPLMGALAAPTGHFFIVMFERSHTIFPRRWPRAVRVGFGGLIVGVMGIWFPQVMSAGYPVITRAMNSELSVALFATLLFMKMVATSVTFGSGAVGGLFAPTLVMGALYGGAVGYGVHAIAPSIAPQPELFVLLGMIVMFGSIVKGYWSGLLMVADMSGCYHQLLLPGVIAGGITFFLSWELRDRSIFNLPLEPATGRQQANNLVGSVS